MSTARNLFFVIVLPFCIGIAFNAVANAQTAAAGTISGTIVDSSGAVVPAASVVMHSNDTGVDRTTQTNSDGIYSATFLPPGHYDVTIDKTGFAKVVREGLTLEVGANSNNQPATACEIDTRDGHCHWTGAGH